MKIEDDFAKKTDIHFIILCGSYWNSGIFQYNQTYKTYLKLHCHMNYYYSTFFSIDWFIFKKINKHLIELSNFFVKKDWKLEKYISQQNKVMRN